jgi:hypothetical protein
MYSSCREDIVKRFDALHDAVSDVLDVSVDALTTPECLALLERLETETRRLPATGHALITQLARQASETELGGTLTHALATTWPSSTTATPSGSTAPNGWPHQDSASCCTPAQAAVLTGWRDTSRAPGRRQRTRR